MYLLFNSWSKEWWTCWLWFCTIHNIFCSILRLTMICLKQYDRIPCSMGSIDYISSSLDCEVTLFVKSTICTMFNDACHDGSTSSVAVLIAILMYQSSPCHDKVVWFVHWWTMNALRLDSTNANTPVKVQSDRFKVLDQTTLNPHLVASIIGERWYKRKYRNSLLAFSVGNLQMIEGSLPHGASNAESVSMLWRHIVI